jgi:glycosyltransferase involved in cell wall biosynthesis
VDNSSNLHPGRAQKVLFVLTKGTWGGAQRYVFDLARSLPQEQFQVSVASGDAGELQRRLTEKHIPVITLPHLTRDIRFSAEVRAFVRLLRLFWRERPDVIHLNSPKTGGLGSLAARVYKILSLRWHVRIIFTVHGFSFREDRALIIRAIIFLLEWLTSIFVDELIVISRLNLRDARWFVPDHKLHFIPPGIPEAASRSREQARAALGEPENAMCIGTITEYIPNKGIPYLLRAFASAPSSARLVIIGDGPERQDMEALAYDLGIKNRVSFTGFIPDAASLLPAFDIFVFPSLKEGLPYVILEAIRAGVPVIATNVGGIPDLIEHETNGLLIPRKNAAALSRAMTLLTGDPELRAIFAKTAHTRLRDRYSLQAMVRDTQALYVD